MSTYVNKVDRKGRVSVPATFRAQITGQSFPGIVAYPMPKHAAIEASGIDRMEAISTGLDDLDDPEQRQDIATMVFGQSHHLPFDPEGRVLLPEHLVAYAHLTENAAFVGLGPTFQIWEPDRFAAHQAAARERLGRQDGRMPSLGTLAGRRRQ